MGPPGVVRGGETAGPSTTLRSGRDDKFVGRSGHFPTTNLSSLPERSVVEGPAVSPPPKTAGCPIKPSFGLSGIPRTGPGFFIFGVTPPGPLRPALHLE